MFPFDNSMQKDGKSDSFNNFTYNYTSSLPYIPPSYPWNMDYPNMATLSYHPTNNYYYMPNSEYLVQDQIKCANQSTRPSDIKEPQIDEKEKLTIAVQAEIQRQKQARASQIKIPQKFGRNILSNIFHITIKKLISSQFIGHIQRTIEANKMSITVQQFKIVLEEKTKGIKGYINMKTIKGLLVGKPIGATRLDLQFRKLLRTLCKVYFNNFHLLHIYSTGKIKKQSRMLHLKCLRKLSKKMKR